MKTLTTTLALATALLFTACTKEDIAPEGLQPTSTASAKSLNQWPNEEPNPVPLPVPIEEDHSQVYENPASDYTAFPDKNEAPPPGEDENCKVSCAVEHPGDRSSLKAIPGTPSAPLSIDDAPRRNPNAPEQNPAELNDRDPNIDPNMR